MSASQVSTEKDVINLNVISPASSPICFRDIPTSTSVAVLKEKISQASPTHPAPDAQRLLYRGHVLVLPSKTLKEIFTQEVINENDSLTIHLIPPPDASHLQPTGTSIPNTTQSAPITEHQMPPASHHVQRVTFSATFNGQPSVLPFPSTQVHSDADPRHQQGEGTHNATQTSDLPQAMSMGPQAEPSDHVPMSPLLQAQLTAMRAQQQAQAHALFAHQLAMMRQHAAFTDQLPRMHGNGQGPSAAPFSPPSPSQGAPQATPGALNQDLTNNGPYMNSNPPPPWASPEQQTVQSSNNVPSRPTPAHGHSNHSDISFTNQFQQNSPRSQAEAATHYPRHAPFVPPTSSATPAQPLRFSYTNSAGVPTMTTQSAHQISSHAFPHASIARRPQSNAIYLLSSPSGPQALLVSPSGLFTTPWVAPQAPAMIQGASSQMRSSFSPPAGGHSHTLAGPSSPAINLPDRRQTAGGRIQTPAQGGNANMPPVNQEQRDIGQIAARLSSHLWTLVRLFGFIWFFSHGASTSRTVGLCFVGALVFLGQVGLFQGLWQRIRRRADEVLHFGGGDLQDARAANNGADSSGGGAGAITPEQAAARLRAEQQQQQVHAFRQVVRRCERAAVLFFGSLAPGLAERHIQARNEAETARQRQLREQEERERRREEDAHKVEGEGVFQQDGAGSSNEQGVEGPVPSQAQASPHAQGQTIQI